MSSLIFTFLYKYAQHMLVHFAPSISQSLHIKLKQNVYLEITRIFLYFLPGMARNSLHRYTCIYIYGRIYLFLYQHITQTTPSHSENPHQLWIWYTDKCPYIHMYKHFFSFIQPIFCYLYDCQSILRVRNDKDHRFVTLTNLISGLILT